MDDYDVQTIIRVGACDALSEAVKVRDLILDVIASTDSDERATLPPRLLRPRRRSVALESIKRLEATRPVG